MSLLNKASLIQIPSGYKDGTLYSAKPTNGDGDFTFSRGSNLAATRVDSEGLIEKGRENLFLHSNSFDTTWSTNNASVTGGQSGYDGSSDAWKVDISAAAGKVQQSISTSGVQTISFYAKSGTCDFVRITVDGGNGIYFNLSSGTKGTILGSIIDSNIEQVGATDWYRCSMAISQAITALSIYPAIADNNLTGTSGNIYIQDAQLELGLVSTDVITTTTTTAQAGILEDMPRLDYSGGASCGHLLLEPQRSNLVTQSEYFNDSSWSSYVFGGASLTKTFGYTSPEGVDNAYKLDVVVGTGGVLFTHNFTATASVDHTLSIWMKGEVGGEKVQIDLKNTSSNGITGSLLTLTNEWKRYDLTLTNDTGTSRGFQFRMQQSSGLSDQTIYVYGAMAESSASYPSSYIPTYGASVTRGAESLAISGMSNNLASGVSSTTLFMDFEFQKEVTADTLTFRNSTSALGRGYLYDVRMGMADSYGINITLTENTQQKCIWRLNTLSNATVFANGTKGNTSNGNTWSDVDTIDLFGSRWSMKIKQITLFNSALTDAECIQLTT